MWRWPLHLTGNRMTVHFAPPLTPPDALGARLASAGLAVLDATAVAQASGVPLAALQAWAGDWDALPPDRYLKDGGRYRRRRHASFTLDACGRGEGEGEGWRFAAAPARAHWQPLAYNALHGGMARWFEPVAVPTVESPGWAALMAWLGGVARRLPGRAGVTRWWGEAHQFRIDAEGGIGRPTPEGAHRDGVDLVAVFLLAREGVRGGETRVFDADGPHGVRFTLVQPWSLLLLDDARVVHESTPIQPAADAPAATGGHRDTLVVTLRAGGFLAPEAPS